MYPAAKRTSSSQILTLANKRTTPRNGQQGAPKFRQTQARELLRHLLEIQHRRRQVTRGRRPSPNDVYATFNFFSSFPAYVTRTIFSSRVNEPTRELAGELGTVRAEMDIQIHVGLYRRTGFSPIPASSARFFLARDRGSMVRAVGRKVTIPEVPLPAVGSKVNSMGALCLATWPGNLSNPAS